MLDMSITISKKGTDVKHMAALQYSTSTSGVCEINLSRTAEQHLQLKLDRTIFK